MENINVPPMIPLSKLKGMKTSNRNQGSMPVEKTPVKNSAKEDSPVHNRSADASTILYRLMGVEGVYAQSIFPLDGVIVLGRDPKESNIVYPAIAVHVSRKHCCVWLSEEGQVLIKDLGSSNGTFFADGTRLTPNVAYRLNLGEGFYLGSGREAYKLI